MADGVYELLRPHLDGSTQSTSISEATTTTYIERLITLPLHHLTVTEHESLHHASQSTLRSLQALSKRSHSSVTSAADHLNHLPELISSLRQDSQLVKETSDALEASINGFALKYEKSTENEILHRRRLAALLNRNAERVDNILELPSLLESTINASAVSSGQGPTVISSGGGLSGYASALDLHAHVKRLGALYPRSNLISAITSQANAEICNMITVLITTLQGPGLKLAVAMRTIGWLRRVVPELGDSPVTRSGLSLQGDRAPSKIDGREEGLLGSLFLVCRLITLRRTLEALEPLKALAQQEGDRRRALADSAQSAWTEGVQSERYLKRFIEIFREQSFAIVSMFKSIFPAASPGPDQIFSEKVGDVRRNEGLYANANEQPMFSERASSLAGFVPELVDLITNELRSFLPNVSDRSSRDSLLSQVLFCAGSLGRLGANFGLMLALLEEDTGISTSVLDGAEWVEVMKKHRIQASRLEVLASGVGAGRKGSIPNTTGSAGLSVA